MISYSFTNENLNEGLFLDLLKHKKMCQRAYNLKYKMFDECKSKIKKIKELYNKGIINSEEYKTRLTHEHDIMDRLMFRLSNMDLL